MGNTVVITGSSAGIGSETARVFAENGWNVGIMYMNSQDDAETLEKELENMGVKTFCGKCDVSLPESVKRFFEDAENTLGEIYALVNNAGVALQKLFCDVTEEEAKRLFDINVNGVFNCSKAVLPSMIKAKEGKIVNISSMWGICGASCEVHYSSSKAAVIGFTKALAKEVGPCSINVNCVCPGVIDTRMNANLDKETMDCLKEEIPLMRIGTPRDVAETIYFLCSEKSDYITGQVISVDGGMII
ncbi:MAG: SDR family oxidoreductase [Ruminococcaceae bacterium]|nr:SDR family oxidoreductase [Oscillospiraceae bacterium]